MAKVVCVLYDDPVTGYPKTYARDDCPQPDVYPDGQTLPTPKGIDFKPGQLLGSSQPLRLLNGVLVGRSHLPLALWAKPATF